MRCLHLPLFVLTASTLYRISAARPVYQFLRDAEHEIVASGVIEHALAPWSNLRGYRTVSNEHRLNGIEILHPQTPEEHRTFDNLPFHGVHRPDTAVAHHAHQVTLADKRTEEAQAEIQAIDRQLAHGVDEDHRLYLERNKEEHKTDLAELERLRDVHQHMVDTLTPTLKYFDPAPRGRPPRGPRRRHSAPRPVPHPGVPRGPIP